MTLTTEQLNLMLEVRGYRLVGEDLHAVVRELLDLRARVENVRNLPIHYGSLWIGTTYNCGADTSEWVSRDSLTAAIAEESRGHE